MQTVSLTTDLGQVDHYQAVLKAKIISRSNPIQFVDISHHVSAHDILEAATLVKASFKHFPLQSIHVVLIQNYYSFAADLLFIEYQDHYFIAPDNGIMSLIMEAQTSCKIRKIKFEDDRYSLTVFDKVSHAIACISNGLFDELGEEINEIVEKMDIRPVVSKSEIRATIIHIDKYENAITNLDYETFNRIAAGRAFELFYKHDEPLDRISKNYSDVSTGDTLCLFNSSGLLEIAVNMGKASSLFGLRKNETIQIHFLN